MKKIFLALLSLVFLTSTFATVNVSRPNPKASEIFLPLGVDGSKISLLELSRLKVKEVEQISGKKLSFSDRLAFKIAQKKLRDNISPDGTFDTKRLEKAFKQQQKGGETGFHFGGFALGFFLGLIGLIISFFINDDYKRNRVKWAWIGFGIQLILGLISILA